MSPMHAQDIPQSVVEAAANHVGPVQYEDSFESAEEIVREVIVAALRQYEVEGYRMGRGDVGRCREVLARLVALKDGPRDEGYKRAKPIVWEQARAALDPAQGDEAA